MKIRTSVPGAGDFIQKYNLIIGSMIELCKLFKLSGNRQLQIKITETYEFQVLQIFQLRKLLLDLASVTLRLSSGQIRERSR